LETPIEETLRTLNDLVRAGKVRYIGASNMLGYQLQRAVDYSKFLGLEKFVSIQPQYHLLARGVEKEVLHVAEENELAVLPWSPLAGGWLTGKYNRQTTAPEAGSRVAWAESIHWSATSWSSYANENTWKLLDVLRDVANETHKPISAVSLRWLLQKPTVTAPIIGARTIQQLQDNLEATKFALSTEQMKRLDEASKAVNPPSEYPYNATWVYSREVRPTQPSNCVPTPKFS